MLTKAPATARQSKTSEYVTITPEVAIAWLDKNVSNRKIKKTHVRNLAVAMRNAQWRDIDDPIRFDWNGYLIDGQHRLQAIIMSDTSIKNLVVYGCDPSDIKIIDSGVSRSFTDNLVIDSEKNPTILATACRLMCAEASGVPLNVGGKGAGKVQLEAMLEAHPRLAAHTFNRASFPRGVNAPMVSVLSYVGTSNGKKEEVRMMLETLKSQAPAFKGDPFHAYLKRVFSPTNSFRYGSSGQHEQWTALKHCFNKLCLNEPISVLRIPHCEVSIDCATREWLGRGLDILMNPMGESD